MPTNKRTARKPAGKPRGKASSRPSGSKKRRSTGAAKGSASRTIFSSGVVGLVLLASGIFFSVAFLTGRGAALGEWGFAATTRLLGVTGFALAPLAAIAGALLLAGGLSSARTAGAALLLLAFATTFASTLPENLRFDAGVYPERGGIVGSGIYALLDSIGGTVGAGLALVVCAAAGLSLLTGIAPATAMRAVAAAANALYEGSRSAVTSYVRKKREDRRRAKNVRERRTKQEDLQRSKPEGVPPLDAQDARPTGEEAAGTIGGDSEEAPDDHDEAFEVVLSRRREALSGGVGDDALQDAEPGEYVLPSASLLRHGSGDPEHDAEGTSKRLTRALAELGVEAHVLRAVVGPRVTRYELRLGSGVKVGKVRNLQQDIAYALAATEVRILAPIPGKSAVGVEVPNTRPAVVTLGDVFDEYPAGNDWSLPVGLGKDISGRAVFFDLAEMPHLLVAGTTGAGKSVMLNGLLTSLLLTTDPRRVKMVLVDPKRVELSQFVRVPHLITPVVTDVKKAANALTWAVAEMERRYEVLEKYGARSLDGYNETREKPIPYVVVVIDELADLMMTAAAKVEDAVIRLAQKARAVGIHLVVATQRPSVDVITGMIKANIPSRIAFAVSSQVDSRVILDSVGAEALLGRGDMLFKPVTALRSSRVQGAYISESEVAEVVGAAAAAASGGGAEPTFVEEVTQGRKEEEEATEPEDELLPEVASFVVMTQQASVSAVQRRFRVGYSRAGRIVDALERKGVVGPHEGSKTRSVVATELDLSRIFDGGEDVAAGAEKHASNGDGQGQI